MNGRAPRGARWCLAWLSVMALAGQAGAGSHLPSEHLRIEDAWSRAAPAVAPNGVVYLTAVNQGRGEARMTGARTPAAARAELHSHRQEGGMMKMRPVEGGIPIPAGSSVKLAPGGLHVMLMQLRRPLEPGGSFPLTLEFADGGSIEIDVPVLSVEQAAGKAHAGH